MKYARYLKTGWGCKVKEFTLKYGFTMKQLAEQSGVNYTVLAAVIVGRTPGYKIIPKVDAFMEEYAATHEPTEYLAALPYQAHIP